MSSTCWQLHAISHCVITFLSRCAEKQVGCQHNYKRQQQNLIMPVLIMQILQR